MDLSIRNVNCEGNEGEWVEGRWVSESNVELNVGREIS